MLLSATLVTFVFYIVVLDLPVSVDQEPLCGLVEELVGKLVLGVVVLDLPVVVLDLPGLLEVRLFCTFWWMW